MDVFARSKHWQGNQQKAWGAFLISLAKFSRKNDDACKYGSLFMCREGYPRRRFPWDVNHPGFDGLFGLVAGPWICHSGSAFHQISKTLACYCYLKGSLFAQLGRSCKGRWLEIWRNGPWTANALRIRWLVPNGEKSSSPKRPKLFKYREG